MADGVARSVELLGDADKENVVGGAKPAYMTSTASSRLKNEGKAVTLHPAPIAEEPAETAAPGCAPRRDSAGSRRRAAAGVVRRRGRPEFRRTAAAATASELLASPPPYPPLLRPPEARRLAR